MELENMWCVVSLSSINDVPVEFVMYAPVELENMWCVVSIVELSEIVTVIISLSINHSIAVANSAESITPSKYIPAMFLTQSGMLYCDSEMAVGSNVIIKMTTILEISNFFIMIFVYTKNKLMNIVN